MATSVPETESAPGHYGESKEAEAPFDTPSFSSVRADGKRELEESDAWEVTGYSFPTWYPFPPPFTKNLLLTNSRRKWQILSVVFLIQISMNLNASMYANGVPAIASQYGVSKQAARVPQMTFLVAYAFGCELWAPWSEELGRWPIQQLSLFLVNIWQIPCALAPNYGTFVVCRLLGGLSTAGEFFPFLSMSSNCSVFEYFMS